VPTVQMGMENTSNPQKVQDSPAQPWRDKPSCRGDGESLDASLPTASSPTIVVMGPRPQTQPRTQTRDASLLGAANDNIQCIEGFGWRRAEGLAGESRESSPGSELSEVE
jgi:hypothetical protein